MARANRKREQHALGMSGFRLKYLFRCPAYIGSCLMKRSSTSAFEDEYSNASSGFGKGTSYYMVWSKVRDEVILLSTEKLQKELKDGGISFSKGCSKLVLATKVANRRTEALFADGFLEGLGEGLGGDGGSVPSVSGSLSSGVDGGGGGVFQPRVVFGGGGKVVGIGVVPPNFQVVGGSDIGVGGMGGGGGGDSLPLVGGGGGGSVPDVGVESQNYYSNICPGCADCTVPGA